ncbi:MAG: ferritin-like domain-containing protein [Verrucomicrobiota bacterium]
MNCTRWIEHFRKNRENRPEPDWQAPITMPPSKIAKLIPSLEQFELGDGGGPASLIAHNAESFRGSSEEMRTLVDLWFKEEKEHSRLLSGAVKRFGGRKITGHWSFSAFCACRRILGVRFELQVLLLTEIVSTAYYRLLRRHTDDVAVKQMCSLILRDETGHVSFHRDRLLSEGRSTAGFSGFLWELQFWLCGHGAATMLWANHGPCLIPLGASTAEFYREVRLEIARFVRRLERASASCHLKAITALTPAT